MPDQTPPPETALPRRQRAGTYRICVVCLGNICRSPMAEVVLGDELSRAGLAGAVEVESAGTGDWHIGEPMDSGAHAELARRGYDGSSHRARQFQPSWFGRFELVLAMDRANLAALRRMTGDPFAAEVRLFRSFDPGVATGAPDRHRGEVPDPYGGPADSYRLALDLVLPAARGLTGRLADLPGLPDLPAGGPRPR